jgi:hypothetical protein
VKIARLGATVSAQRFYALSSATKWRKSGDNDP